MKTEIFENDNIREHMRAHAPQLEVSFFESFSRIRVDGKNTIKKRYVSTQIFSYAEKDEREIRVAAV